MLGDTLSITIGGVAKVLPKVNGGNQYSSEYLLTEATKQYRVLIRHTDAKDTNGKKQYRHNAELVVTTFATVTDLEKQVKTYFVTQSDPGTSAVPEAVGLFAWANVGSPTNLTKMDGKES